MSATHLRRVYDTILLPGAEYSSVIYHKLIPNYLSDKLENVQKMAVGIIYGAGKYGKMVEDGELVTLEKRREKAMAEFARKAVHAPGFGQRWFPVAPITERDIRSTTHRKYVEARCKTERMRNNPLQCMARLLNKEIG